MLTTTLTAAVAATVAAVLTTLFVLWTARDTINVYSVRRRAGDADAPASPANYAQATPPAPARTEHTQAPAHAPRSPASADRQPIRIDTPRSAEELLIDALAALAAMTDAAKRNLAYARLLEESLHDARQEAEESRTRAERLQALYVARTQQALHAGLGIVIDHGTERSR